MRRQSDKIRRTSSLDDRFSTTLALATTLTSCVPRLEFWERGQVSPSQLAAGVSGAVQDTDHRNILCFDDVVNHVWTNWKAAEVRLQVGAGLTNQGLSGSMSNRSTNR